MFKIEIDVRQQGRNDREDTDKLTKNSHWRHDFLFKKLNLTFVVAFYFEFYYEK